jgi:cyclophilin family peptidyl-prolyl cis-trans isomerase
VRAWSGTSRGTVTKFWEWVDEDGYTKTYLHRVPHGMLIRVRTIYGEGAAECVTFVPNQPHAEGPFR